MAQIIQNMLRCFVTNLGCFSLTRFFDANMLHQFQRYVTIAQLILQIMMINSFVYEAVRPKILVYRIHFELVRTFLLMFKFLV